MIIKILKKEWKKGKSLQLKEFLEIVPKCKVKDEKCQAYTSEIVIPFVKLAEPNRKNESFSNSLPSKMIRNFEIGSEWVYFNLYTGTKTAEKILRETIGPLAAKMENKGIVDKWFFVKYYDPDFHIRVRFHVHEIGKVSEVITAFCAKMKPLIKTNEVKDYSLKTYKREIERYGLSTMDISETMFFYNSKLTIRLLEALNNQKSVSHDIRLFIGIYAISSFLDEFHYSDSEKLEFYIRHRNGFAKEFKLDTDKELKEKIQIGYRSNRKNIDDVLKRSAGSVSDFNTYFEIVDQYNHQCKAAIRILRSLAVKEKLVSLNSLIGSYIHMFINRLFSEKNRTYEFIIYEYLERSMTSNIKQAVKKHILAASEEV